MWGGPRASWSIGLVECGHCSAFHCSASGETRPLMAWVKMKRRDRRSGDRGEGKCLSLKGCFSHVTRNLDVRQDGCHSWPQHYVSIPGGTKREESWDPPVVPDFF